jgi:hypothetical protein
VQEIVKDGTTTEATTQAAPKQGLFGICIKQGAQRPAS